MIVTAYVLGILLQAVATIIALWQVRISPRRLPWLLIAVSSLLLVARRVASLNQTMNPGDDVALAEILTCVISLLFFLGVLFMSRMFREIAAGQEARQRSEKLLTESQRIAGLGSYVVDDVSVGSWRSSDVLDEIFGIDEAYERSLGGWENLIHPDDRTMMAEYFRNEVAGQGKRFDKEYRIIRRNDGAERWVHGMGRLDFDAQGRPRTMQGTIRDVTERKQAEVALREANEQKQLLLDGISDAFFAMDEQMVVTYYNGAAERLLGRTAQDVLGHALFDAFPEARGSVFETNYRRAIETKQFATFEVHFEVSPFVNWYDVRVYPTRQGIAVFFQITTERKKAERVRLDLEEQLRQAQKMEAIGTLAGGVAHDFRNQLQVIMGFGDILRSDDLVKEEGREMLDHIIKAAERSAKTTGRLLAYSRREILSPIQQSVGRCVAEIGKILPHMIGEDIRLIVQSSNEDDQSLFDSHLMEQAITNLATNARDAMPKGGTLRIETACATLSEVQSRQIDSELAAGQYVVISVSDTGSGMDKATLAKAFDPFFTTKDAGKGSGLGLPMVYGFVKQSGGAIAIQSEPNQGTTVRLYFPRIVSAPVEGVVRQDAGALRGGHETVLVVEDEASVLAMAAKLLRGAGYRVLEAASAEDALVVVERHDSPPDLLVADIVMPGMNGLALAERLCGRYPGLGVLHISGYPGEELARRGVNDSADILLKPFTPESLLAKARHVLDTRKTSPGV